MRRSCVLAMCAFFAAAAAVAAEPDRVTCSGKVVAPGGAAVEGVVVEAYHRTVDDSLLGARPVGEVTTREDGAFAFSMPADRSEWPGQVKVFASKEGFALGWAVWGLDRDLEVTIQLQQPATLAGTVVDEAGRGVPGAEVRALLAVPQTFKGRESYAQIFGVAPFDRLAVDTDTEGRFVFNNIPPEGKAELLVSAPARATLVTGPALNPPRAMQYGAGQADIRIVLPKEARISGVLVDKATGQPVVGQELEVYLHGPGSSFARTTCVSTDDGAFDVGGLCPGTHGLRPAVPQRRLAEWVAAPVYVKTKSGQSTGDVRIELGRGGMLEILVTDTVADRPIEGVRTNVDHRGVREHVALRTDKDGVCRARMSPGKCHVYGSKKRYKHPGTAEVNVVEGETTRLAFKLRPFPKVKGRIVDPTGKPVPGASVRFGSFGPERITDAAGEFEIEPGLTSCTEDYQFHLLVLQRERNLARVMAVGDGPQTMDVKLLPGVTIAGRTADPDGKPVAGAKIEITWHTTAGYSNYGEPLATNAEGRYELGGLPPGQSFHLSATAEGYGRDSTEVTLAEEGDERVKVKDLVVERASLSLSGTVVNGEGKAVPAIYVSVSGEGQSGRTAKTDADGRFKVGSLCKGKVYVTALFPDAPHVSGGVEAEAGAQDVRVVVRVPGFAKVTTIDQSRLTVGKALPELKGFHIRPAPQSLEDRMILICFWDMEQRSARRCVKALAARAEKLSAAGIQVVLVHAASVEEQVLQNWAKDSKIAFPVGMIKSNGEDTRRTWGVRALPWLILTDREHVVTAEGFPLADLDARMAGR